MITKWRHDYAVMKGQVWRSHQGLYYQVFQFPIMVTDARTVYVVFRRADTGVWFSAPLSWFLGQEDIPGGRTPRMVHCLCPRCGQGGEDTLGVHEYRVVCERCGLEAA